MLDVAKLAALRAVLDHGSFSAAARSLNLTQPAVSRQIAALERRTGTVLLVRSRSGVRPTEAGRLLAAHAAAVLDRLALAERQLAELAGLRRGHVRLGSFYTAVVHLSAEATAALEQRHPALFDGAEQVIQDELVDRRAAFAGLMAGELDVAIVYEHHFERAAAPDEIELLHLFTDPPRILLPATHALAARPRIDAGELAQDTWLRAHSGSAARLVDDVLRRAGIDPPVRRAGHGDEPIEIQALVAAGQGVTVAHRLNVLIDPENVVAVPLADERAARDVQAAVLRGPRAPAVSALLDTLLAIGRRKGTAGPQLETGAQKRESFSFLR